MKFDKKRFFIRLLGYFVLMFLLCYGLVFFFLWRVFESKDPIALEAVAAFVLAFLFASVDTIVTPLIERVDELEQRVKELEQQIKS